MDWKIESSYRQATLRRDADLIRAGRAARRRRARENLARVLRLDRQDRRNHDDGDQAASAHHDDSFVSAA